jgi:pimeloyl-ACP methyl ester carboxylesterase
MSVRWTEKNASKTYVLIHGAWHGSWCWGKVAPRLRSLGHEVVTPDLPGHHHHQRNFKDISLASYVSHIEAILLASSKPVVLVGHSMAGVVVTQVAENLPDKIDHLIYISAFIPENGGSLMDEEKQATIPSVALEVTVNQEEYLLSLNSLPRVRDLFYANCSDEDARYALSLLQPQPLRPFTDTISISSTRFGQVPKLYIECLQDRAIMIRDQRRMYAKINCDVATANTDHSPFFSTDQMLVELICKGLRE